MNVETDVKIDVNFRCFFSHSKSARLICFAIEEIQCVEGKAYSGTRLIARDRGYGG